MDNLKNIDLNKLAAIGLLLLTTAVIAAIVYFVAFARKKKNSVPEKDKPVKGKNSQNGGFSHCELNDIMGYEFIQVKNPVFAVNEIKKAPVQEDYSKSQGIGMTDRTVSTTGAKAAVYEDEPVPSKEQQEKNREMERMNKESEQLAKESETTTVLTQEESAMLGMYDSWAETEEEAEEKHRLNELIYDKVTNYDGIPEDEEADAEILEDEQANALASKPQEPELYQDNQQKMLEAIDAIQNSVYDKRVSDEQEEIISKLNLEE